MGEEGVWWGRARALACGSLSKRLTNWPVRVECDARLVSPCCGGLVLPSATRPTGNGAYGRSFARKVTACGIPAVIGSRSPPDGAHQPSWATPCAVLSHAGAVAAADLVVLAIPAAAHGAFVGKHADALAGKVLVDVANPPTPSAASTLCGLLPQRRRARGRGGWGAASAPAAPADGAPPPSTAEALAATVAAAGIPRCHVVKAFNNVPAYALDEPSARTPPPLVCAAGRDGAAKAAVLSLARRLGFDALDAGGLHAARAAERAVHRCFDGWVGAATFSAALLLAWSVYWASRYYAFGEQDHANVWWQWLLVPWGDMGALLLAVTFLPGSVAAVVQLARWGRHPFPGWLAAWLAARKQLGLVGFWFAAVHSVAAASNGFPPASGNFRPLFDHYLYWAAGVLALGCYWVLAAASSPATAAGLSWAEFRFVFSFLGLVTMGLTLTHVGVLVKFYTQHNDANPVQTVFLAFSVLALSATAMLAFKVPPLSLAVRHVRAK